MSITKTADATPVSTGTAIGFSVTISNASGPSVGTATGVAINDPLPAGSGVLWSISPAYSGAGTCAITGPAGSQVLACTIGTMAPGASDLVHISSATTAASAGPYPNTATLTSTNGGPPLTSTAATIVVGSGPVVVHHQDGRRQLRDGG